MKIIGILLLILIACGVLAAIYLPWWGTVGGIVLIILAGKIFGGRIVESLFKIPFRAKGAVLRGATADVHSLTPIARPAAKTAAAAAAGEAEDGGDDGGTEEDADRRFYVLEVTVKPVVHEGGAFQLWEPGELLLVSQDAKAEDTDDDGELCNIKQIEIESEGQFAKDEGMKYGGLQRLRLTLAVAPDARQLQFRYNFELFGKVSLPG
jgi:hypothetical protein